jgi:urease accessory protein
MLRAVEVMPRGQWAGAAVDTVVLDYDDRHRRRMAMQGVNGLGFLLDLPKAAALADGDGLKLSDGRVVAVKAAAERLLEVTCADRLHMARVAWHLGNRHLPTVIEPGRLLIREDHVIAEMLRGLGAEVRAVEAPFHPEGGAYGEGRVHGHDHAHDHDDDHRHHNGTGHAHG